MTYHTPVLEDNIGKITPTSGSLGSLGLPITDLGRDALQLTPVAGITEYGDRGGFNQVGAVGALQNTDAPAFNGVVD